MFECVFDQVDGNQGGDPLPQVQRSGRIDLVFYLEVEEGAYFEAVYRSRRVNADR